MIAIIVAHGEAGAPNISHPKSLGQIRINMIRKISFPISLSPPSPDPPFAISAGQNKSPTQELLGENYSAKITAVPLPDH